MICGLVFAIKQQRPEMVKCLLDLQAHPSWVLLFCDAQSRARWVPRTVKELAERGTEIAQLPDHAIHEWNLLDR